MVSPTARRCYNWHKCIHSPHSIASRIVPTPRWQELGSTCFLQLSVPEPSEPIKPRNSKTCETAATFRTSEPIETRNLRNLQNHGNFPNLGYAISGTWNLSEPIKTWNHLLSEPIKTWNRFPESGSFPEPPQLAQNTPKSILCKDPIAFCCWGKMWDFGKSTFVWGDLRQFSTKREFMLDRGGRSLYTEKHAGICPISDPLHTSLWVFLSFLNPLREVRPDIVPTFVDYTFILRILSEALKKQHMAKRLESFYGVCIFIFYF